MAARYAALRQPTPVQGVRCPPEQVWPSTPSTTSAAPVAVSTTQPRGQRGWPASGSQWARPSMRPEALGGAFAVHGTLALVCGAGVSRRRRARRCLDAKKRAPPKNSKTPRNQEERREDPPGPPDPCTAFSVYQQHQEPSSEEQQQAQRSSRTTRSWFGTMEEYPVCHVCRLMLNGRPNVIGGAGRLAA